MTGATATELRVAVSDLRTLLARAVRQPRRVGSRAPSAVARVAEIGLAERRR